MPKGEINVFVGNGKAFEMKNFIDSKVRKTNV